MKQKNVILMVVAVGCGLGAAVLTSQMSGRSAKVDQVEVIVAAKDLPVGTFLTKDELKTAIKRKKVSKDGLPPAFVQDESELLDKRLARGIRMEETFNPKDLTKGGLVTLPPGMNMVSIPIGGSQAVTGFVGPGSRVDVLATVRHKQGLLAFPLMVNMLVVAVNTDTAYDEKGVFPNVNTVSFAVDRRQALLLAMARSRGCNLELMLRNPEAKQDDTYSIEKVEAILRGDKDNSADIIDEQPTGPSTRSVTKTDKTDPDADPTKTDGGRTGAKGTTGKTADGKVEEGPVERPKVEVVLVPVATETIPPGTKLTADLVREKFKEKEFRKSDVEDALSLDDLKKWVDEKELKTGLGKGQFVTGEVLGEPGLKTTKREIFDPKDIPQPEATPAPAVTPAPTPEKRRRHEVTLHAPGGSKVFVYEEIRPGEWRLIGERPVTHRSGDSD